MSSHAKAWHLETASCQSQENFTKYCRLILNLNLRSPLSESITLRLTARIVTEIQALKKQGPQNNIGYCVSSAMSLTVPPGFDISFSERLRFGLIFSLVGGFYIVVGLKTVGQIWKPKYLMRIGCA